MDVRFNKIFKVAIVSMFKEPKETVLKEVNKAIKIMSHEIENISEVMEIVKKKTKTTK